MSHIGTAQRALDSGLVLDLRFNEGGGTKAYDSSEERNHGTFGAGAAAPTWASDGIIFDGTDDKITVLDDNSLDVINKFTMLAKVQQTDDSGVSQFQRISDKGANLTVWLDDSTMRCAVRLSATKGGGSEQVIFTKVFLQDTDYEICVVYDKDATDGRLKLYVDGIFEESSDYYSDVMVANATALVIGNQVGGSRSWYGKIYYYQIWGETALSAEEVAQVYASRQRTGTQGPLDEGLVLDLRFSEGAGTKVFDVSGNRRHATIFEGTWASDGLIFDGDDDYGSIPNEAALHPDNMTCFVIFELLGYPDEWEHLIGQGSSTGPTGSGWHIDIPTPSNYIRFFFYDGSGDRTIVQHASALLLNQEYSVAIVRESDVNVKIYLDGDLKHTSGSVIGKTVSTSALSIASRADAYDKELYCKIKYIALFNVVKSEEDIKLIHASRERF